MRRTAVVAGAACVAGALCAGACARRGKPVAMLVEAKGTVERSESRDWVGAAPGDGLALGDSLRTGPRSEARLRLMNDTLIRLAENGRLRLQGGSAPSQQGAKPQLAMELGSAEIEQAADEIAVATALGPARVSRGAHLRLRADDQGAALEVLVGRAVVMRPDGETAVEAGEGVRIKIGAASVERFRVGVGQAVIEPLPPRTPPAAAPPPEPPPPEPPAPAAVEATPARHEDARADVTLAAGESATLHDPKRSLALRLRFDSLCPDEAVVEVGTGRHPRKLTGEGAVVVKLSPGAHRYRIRCAGDAAGAKPRASGLLSLKRDNGNVPLSRRAPLNVIDADGRRYTVLFQTRLPELTLWWPKAPAQAQGLALHVESPGGSQVFPVSQARHKLPSGSLPEGTYTWWYAADGDVSPKTTVTIRFDNAAPTAQFFRAAPSADVPRGAIPIEGVTLEGAKVSAGGRPVPIDDRGRFHAAVTPSAGDDAVVVRLEHPRTGIHYYVRRATP